MATPPPDSYGTTRERAASVSFTDIETAARHLMLAGEYPSVGAVRKQLKRGSTTTIAEAMRRFWRNQAALNVGDPVALTRIPPELADAAVAQWEKALLLSQQVAEHDDNAARAQLQALQQDTDRRAQSIELREKEWDIAARVRERALADTRQQVGVLVGELAAAHAEIRGHALHIAELETEIEHLRQQLANVIARAVARHRSRPRAAAGPSIRPNRSTASRRRRPGVKAHPRPVKRALPIKSRNTSDRSVPKGKAIRRPTAQRRQ